MNAGALLLGGLIGACAAPVLAQDGEACQHVLTSATNDGCQVVEYSVCGNGERRAETFRSSVRSDGALVTDADLSLRSLPPLGGDAATESPITAVEHAFSLDELLAAGRSEGRYAVRFNYREPMIGGIGWAAELTGQEATTSGATFFVAHVRVRIEDPMNTNGEPETEEWHALIDPVRRLMILGPRALAGGTPVVDVALPTEAGFEAEGRSYLQCQVD